MSGKLNHLAITTDHYATIGMFYRAVFGMKVSGDTSREMSAISVGDGYVGMTIIPRRGGRKAGLDHFGIEVEDLDKVREKMAKKYPDIEIVKRPGNRPFASYSAHDPAGNYFDLSQQGHENRAEVYAKGEWKQDNTISHFALRARHAGKMAEFYSDMFDLEARNVSGRARQLSPHRRPRDADDPAVDDFGLQRRRHRAAGDGSHRLPGAEHRRVQEEPRRGREAEPPAASEADRFRFRGRRAAQAAARSARTAASISPIPTAR